MKLSKKIAYIEKCYCIHQATHIGSGAVCVVMQLVWILLWF